MNYTGLALSLAAIVGVTALFAALFSNNARTKPDGPDTLQIAENEPDPPVAGGTDNYTDKDAPKTIVSTQITAFECDISLYGMDLRDDLLLTSPRYRFTAKKDGETVVCTAQTEDGKKEFTKDLSFLDELQKIAAESDLAQYNGISVITHGLPDDFGVLLSVDYASGEHIYAHHNTDMFLPMETVRALVSLFCPRVIVPYTSISMEKAMERMASEPDAVILDVRREDEFEAGHIPGAVCVPNEMIQEEEHDIGFEKDRTLLVYCRSGRRSKEAAKHLSDLGYTAVFEFGGILDWPGDIVTDEDEE